MVAMKEPRRLEHRRRSGKFDAELQKLSERTARVVMQPQAGTALEDLLESYGVTKEWWKEYKAKHGLPPTCGCDRRREYLNELSKAHPTLAKYGVMVFRALTRKTT
jgi:hypothetical protein